VVQLISAASRSVLISEKRSLEEIFSLFRISSFLVGMTPVSRKVSTNSTVTVLLLFFFTGGYQYTA